MKRAITITTGARLHFGLLSHDPHWGRHFGGIGLMIDSPGFELTVHEVQSSDSDRPVASHVRAEAFAAEYFRNTPKDKQPPPVRIEIGKEIPAHIGLGSGTQLGMAIAKALSLLAGEEDIEPAELGWRVRRGRRSALGIHGFAYGGLLVDSGKPCESCTGSPVTRGEFPEQWRFVLVTPREERGLCGEDEKKAFSQLAPMSASTTARLHEIAEQQLLPAAQDANFPACSDALYEFGRTVGDCFRAVQGGTYAHPQMAKLIEHLRKNSIHGAGQTSWGPTIFALCESQPAARQLAEELQQEKQWSNCHINIATPLNTAARGYETGSGPV